MIQGKIHGLHGKLKILKLNDNKLYNNAADSTHAPPMRSCRWVIVFRRCLKPPPQHHASTDAATQGASQMLPVRLVCGGLPPCPTHAVVPLGHRLQALPEAAAPAPRPPRCSPPRGFPNVTCAAGLRRIAPLPHPCVRGAGATTSDCARSRRTNTITA